MVTKYYKRFLANMLQAYAQGASGYSLGGLEIKDVNGVAVYVASRYGVTTTSFPENPVQSPTLSATEAGISVGANDSAESDADYNLGGTVTSGITMQVTQTTPGIDENDDPYIEFAVTITNTGNEPVTISEIGYKQNVTCRTEQGWNAGIQQNKVVLFDRTVLEPKLVIPAGRAGIVTYRLTTDLSGGN